MKRKLKIEFNIHLFTTNRFQKPVIIENADVFMGDSWNNLMHDVPNEQIIISGETEGYCKSEQEVCSYLEALVVTSSTNAQILERLSYQEKQNNEEHKKLTSDEGNMIINPGDVRLIGDNFHIVIKRCDKEMTGCYIDTYCFNKNFPTNLLHVEYGPTPINEFLKGKLFYLKDIHTKAPLHHHNFMVHMGWINES